MIDTHTHILSRMDDGAPRSSVSLALLEEEARQGVEAVVLSPHYYCSRESVGSFLERRRASYERLAEVMGKAPESVRARLPELILGAETAWHPSLLQEDRLRELCVGQTQYLIVEPQMAPWDEAFFSQLYELMNCRGIVPVIAHIDRYFLFQKNSAIRALLALQTPVQISAEAFTSFWTRNRALQAVKKGEAQILISDCHNLQRRAPKITAARDCIRRRLGASVLERMDQNAADLVKTDPSADR